jgi:hypothetical protein
MAPGEHLASDHHAVENEPCQRRVKVPHRWGSRGQDLIEGHWGAPIAHRGRSTAVTVDGKLQAGELLVCIKPMPQQHLRGRCRAILPAADSATAHSNCEDNDKHQGTGIISSPMPRTRLTAINGLHTSVSGLGLAASSSASRGVPGPHQAAGPWHVVPASRRLAGTPGVPQRGKAWWGGSICVGHDLPPRRTYAASNARRTPPAMEKAASRWDFNLRPVFPVH